MVETTKINLKLREVLEEKKRIYMARIEELQAEVAKVDELLSTVDEELKSEGAETQSPRQTRAKRTAGRPRKVLPPAAPKAKRSPGRPRKEKAVEVADAPVVEAVEEPAEAAPVEKRSAKKPAAKKPAAKKPAAKKPEGKKRVAPKKRKRGARVNWDEKLSTIIKEAKKAKGIDPLFSDLVEIFMLIEPKQDEKKAYRNLGAALSRYSRSENSPVGRYDDNEGNTRYVLTDDNPSAAPKKPVGRASKKD